MNHLERLVGGARDAMERRRATTPTAELERALAERPAPRDFLAALRAPGLSLIAEHKRRSPSAGAIREDLGLEQVIAAYERGGAAAISILTEAERFGGSLDDLIAARSLTELPLLRKDFIVERYQLLEAAAAGADAALLIVAALSEHELEALLGEASELGLAALVEVHDERELDIALQSGAPLIGINNRNLATLEVDPRTAFELLGRIPSEVTVVAESGLRERLQLDELERAGAHAVLIGEALMRSADVEAACRTLTAR